MSIKTVNEQVMEIIEHRVEQLGACRAVDVWRSFIDEGHAVLGRWSSEASARAVVRRCMVDLADQGRIVRVSMGRYMSVHEARGVR